MSKITLSEDDAKEFAYGDLEGYEIVEDGDWIADGKWDHKDVVGKHIETGKFYMQTNSRSGSEFTDYEREFGTELTEVYQQKVVVTQWKAVK